MESIDNQPGNPELINQGKLPDAEDIFRSKPIKASNENDYYTKLKRKYKGYLVEGLTGEEKKRIAKYIVSKYNEAKGKHKELCDRITEYDSVYRMERRQLVGDDGDMPNYRSPMTTVACDVIHSNIMNVFFSPIDIMRVIPTEPSDGPKVTKLTIFGNWSSKNELDMFTAIDRIFHSSIKNGECPYIVYWDKRYGVEIKRNIVYNPDDPKEPLYDPDTGSVIYDEEEIPKLLYEGPVLEAISRKDYIQPPDATMNDKPEYEGRVLRYSFDDVLKEEMSGRMFDGAHDEIKSWGSTEQSLNAKEDYQGEEDSVPGWEKECVEMYLGMKINIVKEKGKLEGIDAAEIEELDDEFIATVHVPSQTLCALRKNRFPMKERPLGVDYFMTDDEGRRTGLGVVRQMESLQHSYDALLNQFIWGVEQSNNPFGTFESSSNMRNDPLKIRNGYIYPLPVGAGQIQWSSVPAPNQTIIIAMQLIQQWAQLLFGISDYAAGVESGIDRNSPAKKAELVVQQGNVRLNTIIKRKIITLKDIFRRWYLLYRDNMPKNRFMRIVGSDENNPWKFENIRVEDFELQSLPDFEITGNVLNSNKQLMANMAIASYQLLVSNPFFSPQTLPGLQALHSLTKWLIEQLDVNGIGSFMPKMPGENVNTPEEENARFLQGDDGKPVEQEDHQDHIKKHLAFMQDSLVPDQIKPVIARHIAAHVEMLRQLITQQAIMKWMPQNGQPGQMNGNPQGTPQNSMTPNPPPMQSNGPGMPNPMAPAPMNINPMMNGANNAQVPNATPTGSPRILPKKEEESWVALKDVCLQLAKDANDKLKSRNCENREWYAGKIEAIEEILNIEKDILSLPIELK